MFLSLDYYVTESSGHASEYSPYFRKNPTMIYEDLVPKFTNPHDHWFDLGARVAICAIVLSVRSMLPVSAKR